MKKLSLFVLVLFVSGCAYQPCQRVDLQLKTGYWQQSDGIPGDAPGVVELDCQVANTVFWDGDSINVGFRHQSDILRAAPFNDKWEVNQDLWTIGYKYNIYSRQLE